MPTLDELQPQFDDLTPGEKARVLQWIARDLGDAAPGIDVDPRVCGGVPRIVRSRIPIWTLEQARRVGTSESEILRCFPSLTAEDLVSAWTYVRGHRDEIDAQIRANEEA